MLREIFPKNMYTKYENVVTNITEMSFRIFSFTFFMVQVHHNNIHSIKKKNCRKKKLNFSRSALFHMNTRFCVKYFVLDCHCKLFLFLFWLAPGSFKLDLFNNIGNSEAFNTVKLEQLICKSVLKFVLLDNYFSFF